MEVDSVEQASGPTGGIGEVAATEPFSEYLFGHEEMMATNHRVYHITKKDVVDLLQILSEVSIIYRYYECSLFVYM
jgi:hypothetical protein